MKVRSWLSTCSTTTSTSTATSSATASHTKSPLSDTTSIQTNSSSSSIQSNLSLLTLPSLPSLQKLTLSPENPSATATLLSSLEPNHRTHINFLTLHNNLLYAASGNKINVYDTITNTVVDTFNVEKSSNTGSVKSIAFSNGRIFTAHQDCRIRVWKLTNLENIGPQTLSVTHGFTKKQHKPIATLPTLQDRLRRFVLPQNYVSVRRHKKKLWIEHHDAVSGLAPHQNAVVSVSWDRSVKIWQPQEMKCLESITKAHDDAINAVVLSKDGSIIFTGSADKRIKVWKKEEKKFGLVSTLEKHKSAVNALALGFDGSVLYSGSCDRSILVWEREDSANYMVVTGALRGHGKAILCLINVRDLLLSGSGDRTVRIWQRGGGGDGRYCCLTVLDGHRAPVRSVAALDTAEGGGVKVFSGSFDGEIRVWQVEVS
ncbi:hypothetical protein ACJIZ3_010363 [Penstemon smallii]|uniref:Uncharacterized protein n=1 Tax=Penstemon smallii TaxID=265156 RepID=A0ABD3TH35_9LAMI